MFNVASAIGWAIVLRTAIESYANGLAPFAFWTEVALPLKIVQSMAAFEVLHAMFGLVRSPVFTTFLQGACASHVLWVWQPSCVSAPCVSLFVFVMHINLDLDDPGSLVRPNFGSDFEFCLPHLPWLPMVVPRECVSMHIIAS